MKEETKKIIINILIAVLTVAVVAVVSTIFTNTKSDWYLSLKQPSETVPEIVFPIVWSTIYILFALFIYFNLKNEKFNGKLTTLLIINGILNILWCLVFFTLHQLLLGLICIVLNLIFGFVLLNEINKSNKLFGYLLFIYPIWLSIATCLNLSAWNLN